MSERWPTPKYLAKGRKVRTLVELRSGTMKAPAGIVLTVHHYASDWINAWSEPCASCGVLAGFVKIPIRAVELLPDDRKAVFPDGAK